MFKQALIIVCIALFGCAALKPGQSVEPDGGMGNGLPGWPCHQATDCRADLICDQRYDGGICTKPCSMEERACNFSCCNSMQVCHDGGCLARTECPAQRLCGHVCCSEGNECILGRCDDICPTEVRCGSTQSCCRNGQVCEDSRCLINCGTQMRCGEHLDICCRTGQVCVDNRCLIDCGTQARCGENLDYCCPDGEVCLRSRCLKAGDLCQHNGDCPLDFICDPAIGRCLPRDPAKVCEYIPPVGEFYPVMKCKWSGSDDHPLRDDVVATPAVANLTDDNGDGEIDYRDIPDIAFLSYDLEGTGCCASPATLRVVSGRCLPNGLMQEHFSVSEPVMDNSAGIAIGDLDGDGSPDIVTMKRGGGTVAFERDGTVKWESDQPKGNHFLTAVQPAIANLDGDSVAEVIVGRVVLDGLTGAMRWAGTAGRGINSFLGPLSVVADLDLDGSPEVIAGNTVYDSEGKIVCRYEFGNEGTGCHGSMPCDGFNAVGNFDNDQEGEIVIVREGYVYILEHDCTLKWRAAIPHDDCAYNEGGPPTIADFDGDWRPEIGVAGADYYAVFDMDCKNPLPPYCAAPGVLWKLPNNDCTSRATGSSVFDFDGDGKAEVIYNDEQLFRILRGHDGMVLFEWPNYSHTRLEYPLVVDVDNDGNAEIIFIENAWGGGSDRGLEIWGDQLDNWVNTRRIWNQHTYHITNVDENGGIPRVEIPNWLVPGLNNFRQNVQGDGIFDAPDLVAENLSISKRNCPPNLELSVLIANRGSLGVANGVQVAVYLDQNGQRTLLGVTQTSRDLLPGASELVTFTWEVPQAMRETGLSFVVVADDNGTGLGLHNECIETNNSTEPSVPIVCWIG